MSKPLQVKTTSTGNTLLIYPNGKKIEIVKKQAVLPKTVSYTDEEVAAMEVGYINGSEISEMQQTAATLRESFTANEIDVLWSDMDVFQLVGLGQGTDEE